VKYFNRMLLTAEDMRTDQDFVLQKLRRHNRFLHGFGVVCGLDVSAAPTAEQPWRVQVNGGYALGPFGDEIFVGQPVFMDLATCGPGTVTNPCEPTMMVTQTAAAAPEIFLAIKYAECRARPVLAMPGGCGCEDEACEYSRIRDSFSLECLGELPTSHVPDPDAPTLCELANGKRFATCAPCPTDPWVVLAKIKLPGGGGTQLAQTAIDNKPPIRRIIFSTALIQEQVIKCCCGGREEEPIPPQRETTLVVQKEAPPRIERGNERDTLRYVILVRNDGPIAAEKVRIDERLGDISLLPDFRAEGFFGETGTVWLDTDPPDLVAEIPRIEPGSTVALGLTISYDWRRLRQNTAVRNRVVVSSQTPLTPNSVLDSDTSHPVHIG
jgi:hypothetical protein